jgi:hypothetical protein
MSFQLTFLGYYLIKSQQLKKQTHSLKRRNRSHRERTAQVDGPRWTAQADGDCGWPLVDGAAVRLCRTAFEDGPSVHQMATPSGGRRAAGPSIRRSRWPTNSRQPRLADGRQGGRGRPDV